MPPSAPHCAAACGWRSSSAPWKACRRAGPASTAPPAGTPPRDARTTAPPACATATTPGADMAAPQPGDFGLCSIAGPVGTLIRVGQWLVGEGFREYEHAFIVTEAEPPEHPGMVGAIAAFPGGAKHVLYPVDG